MSILSQDRIPRLGLWSHLNIFNSFLVRCGKTATLTHQKSVYRVIHSLHWFLRQRTHPGIHVCVENSWLLHNCCFLYCHFHYTDAAMPRVAVDERESCRILFFSQNRRKSSVPPWAKSFHPACLNRKCPWLPLSHKKMNFVRDNTSLSFSR